MDLESIENQQDIVGIICFSYLPILAHKGHFKFDGIRYGIILKAIDNTFGPKIDVPSGPVDNKGRLHNEPIPSFFQCSVKIDFVGDIFYGEIRLNVQSLFIEVGHWLYFQMWGWVLFHIKEVLVF